MRIGSVVGGRISNLSIVVFGLDFSRALHRTAPHQERGAQVDGGGRTHGRGADEKSSVRVQPTTKESNRVRASGAVSDAPSAAPGGASLARRQWHDDVLAPGRVAADWGRIMDVRSSEHCMAWRHGNLEDTGWATFLPTQRGETTTPGSRL